jgi:TRAP-type mannitol/chloroaromatic compound transport system permease small subunit
MLRLLNITERINEQLGRWIAWAGLAMVIVTFAVVVLRYLFDLGWIAMQESITYLHAALFMIGAAYTLQHQGHVRVDVFYRRFPPRVQAWVDLLGTLILLFPLCLFMLWISWDYVSDSWALWEGSREAGGLPLVWLLKSLIPLLATLLLIQGMVTLMRCWLFLQGRLDRLYDDQEKPGEEI